MILSISSFTHASASHTHWHRVCPETLVTIKHSFATKLCQLNLLSFSPPFFFCGSAKTPKGLLSPLFGQALCSCVYIYIYTPTSLVCINVGHIYTCLRWIRVPRKDILIANQMTYQKGTNPITN